MDTFQYQPLPSLNSIRVIKLLETGPDKLSIALEAVELGTIRYTALSYRWGDPDDTVAIECNHQELKITRSLFDALWTLKDHYDVEVIWADQICIDQTNLAEKSQQVQRMHQIYSEAVETWAWLGCLDANTSRAMDIIRDRYIDSQVSIMDRILQPEKVVSTGVAFGVPEPGSLRWNLVRDFFTKEWFRRMWIVQEVCLSKVINLTYGKRFLEWDEFKKAIDSFRTYRPDTPGIEPAYNLSQRAQSEDLSVLTSLEDCRNFEATDPRDKVYALQALTPSLKIVPDYTKTVEAVYTDAATAITQGYLEDPDCTSPLQLLWASPDIKHASDKAHSLPSWVPDWRHSFPNGHGDFAYMQVNSKIHSRVPPPSITADHLLMVRGVRVAKISEVQTSATGDGVVSTIANLFNGLKFVKTGGATLADGKIGDLLTVFLHTITAGRFHLLEGSGVDLQSLLALILQGLIEEDLATAEPLSWSEVELTRSSGVNIASSAARDGSTAAFLAPQFNQAVDLAVRDKKLAITVSGELALVPRAARPGDFIVVLCACNFPVVLREVDKTESQHIGLGYLDRVSQGDVVVESLHEFAEFVIR